MVYSTNNKIDIFAIFLKCVQDQKRFRYPYLESSCSSLIKSYNALLVYKISEFHIPNIDKTFDHNNTSYPRHLQWTQSLYFLICT